MPWHNVFALAAQSLGGELTGCILQHHPSGTKYCNYSYTTIGKVSKISCSSTRQPRRDGLVHAGKCLIPHSTEGIFGSKNLRQPCFPCYCGSYSLRCTKIVAYRGYATLVCILSEGRCAPMIFMVLTALVVKPLIKRPPPRKGLFSQERSTMVNRSSLFCQRCLDEGFPHPIYTNPRHSRRFPSPNIAIALFLQSQDRGGGGSRSRSRESFITLSLSKQTVHNSKATGKIKNTKPRYPRDKQTVTSLADLDEVQCCVA